MFSGARVVVRLDEVMGCCEVGGWIDFGYYHYGPYAPPDSATQNPETDSQPKKCPHDFAYSSTISSPINRIFRKCCSSSLFDTLREYDSLFLVVMVADRSPQKPNGSKHHEVSLVY